MTTQPTETERYFWAQSLVALLCDGRNAPCAATAIIAWTFAENGWFGNQAAFNPLNDTQPYPGSRAVIAAAPGVYVQAYPSVEIGLVTTSETIHQANMAPILDAIRWAISLPFTPSTASAAVWRLASALETAPWGTDPNAVRGAAAAAISLCQAHYQTGDPVTQVQPDPDPAPPVWTAEERAEDPYVSLALHPTGRGYWILRANGEVFAFGDSQYLGAPADKLEAVAVAAEIRATPTGNGYYIVSSDGGVFCYGDAVMHGSIPGLNPQPTPPVTT